MAARSGCHVWQTDGGIIADGPECFQAHVATLHGPFVVLFEQDGTDESDVTAAMDKYPAYAVTLGGRYDGLLTHSSYTTQRPTRLQGTAMIAFRAEGRIGGRKKLDTAKRREIAESVISGRKTGAEMARLHNVSTPTVSRIVADHRAGLA